MELRDHLRAGDLVVVAQGSGEPTALLRRLVAAHTDLPDVEVFVGLSHSDALRDPGARALRLVSFGAMGPLAGMDNVAVLPGNFVDMPRLLRARAAGRRLVVLLQVAPATDGQHSLSIAVDYTWELLDDADVVLAEINDASPATSAPIVAASRFAATLSSSRPLPTVADRPAGDVHRRIAGHVRALVPDGATVQLGIGTLAAATGVELCTARDLRVCSTLVGDWLAGLADAGALAGADDAVLISEAAGTARLYEYAASPAVRVRPVREVVAAAARAAGGLVAMNSALEVDLSGQVNAETLDGRYVAGVGGQADFLRAAAHSDDGRAVVMLPSTAKHGTRSRVVRRLPDGVVSTPRTSVDLVVTEHGVADLRGKDLAERAEALIAIAAPEHRALLLRDEPDPRRESA